MSKNMSKWGNWEGVTWIFLEVGNLAGVTFGHKFEALDKIFLRSRAYGAWLEVWTRWLWAWFDHWISWGQEVEGEKSALHFFFSKGKSFFEARFGRTLTVRPCGI